MVGGDPPSLLCQLPDAVAPRGKVTQVSTCDSHTEQSLLLSLVKSLFAQLPP